MVRIMAPLMAVLLCLALAGCGCSRRADEAPEDTADGVEQVEPEPAPEGQPEEPPATQAEHVVRVIVGDGANDALTELEQIGDDEIACVITRGGSADYLAQSLKDGMVDVVVVPLDVAGLLYTGYECPSMAIDALAGDPPIVSVVSYDFFREDPEAVVTYVARHRELAEAADKTFYRGSKMQDVLGAAIADLYVANPSSVGDDLPPDNFYFLG